jgi:amidase
MTETLSQRRGIFLRCIMKKLTFHSSASDRRECHDQPLTTMDAFASAHALLAALRDGQISVTALVEFHLARIARYNQELNAIVIPNYEQARRRAAEAEAAHRRGESFGPLHGLPLTIKDSIEVAGLRTTAGLAARAEIISVEHARLSRRLLAAGGILLGKTNVPPYAGD